MSYVETICDGVSDEFIGPQSVFLLICLLIQTVACVYLFYQTCYMIRKKQKHISRALTLVLQLYMIVVWIYLAANFLPFFYASIAGGDFSNIVGCYNDVLSMMPAGLYFILSVAFWMLRLNIVFKDSIYRVSKNEMIIISAMLIIAGISGEVSILYAFIDILLTVDKNDVFCNLQVTNVDFLIYFNKSWVDYPRPFYDCEGTADSLFIGTLIAAISVPLLNIIISVEYIRRFYSLFNQQSKYTTPMSMSSQQSSDQQRSASPEMSKSNNTTNNNNNDEIEINGNIFENNLTINTVNNNNNNNNNNMSIASGTHTPSMSPQSTISPVMSTVTASQQNNMGNLEISDNNSNDNNNNNNNNYNIQLSKQISFHKKVSEKLTTMKKFSKRDKKVIYRNSFIALSSTLSSFLALFLYMMNANAVVFIYFDAILNGLLMMSVFTFGEWIFDIFFIKMCQKCCCCCYHSCCAWYETNES